MALYFYNKHIHRQMMNKNEKIILGVLYFFSHEKRNSCGVAIGYCGAEAFKVANTACDKKWTNSNSQCRNFLLINFYNSNTEFEQLSTFPTPQKLLEKVDDYNKKNVGFGGDFNLIFDCKFDASGGNPILKRSL